MLPDGEMRTNEKVGSTPSERRTTVRRSAKPMNAKETQSGAIRQSEPIKKTSLLGGFFVATRWRDENQRYKILEL